MNKKKLALTLTITSVLFFALTSLSCKQDTFFYQIEQETELEEEVLAGAVTSVVKFGDKLYACDGGLYSKTATKIRGWNHVSKPSGFIVKLAASTDYLYALNSDDQIFMKTEASDWKKLSSLGFEGSIQTIFCDGNGKAYLQTKKSVDEEKVIVYYSFNGESISEDSDVPSSVLSVRGDIQFYVSGKTIVSVDTTDPSATSSYKLEDDVTIYSISFSVKDLALYVGTNEGLKKLPVSTTDGLLTGESVSLPGSNHESTIKDDYDILAVLATASDSDTDAALYCSTIWKGSEHTMVNGLWGYYYDRRDTWNVE